MYITYLNYIYMIYYRNMYAQQKQKKNTSTETK